jgi:hypothetical protein
VAYVVGHFFGLDTSRSAFYLTSWQDDKPETITSRLGRIRQTASELITTVCDQSGIDGPHTS